MNIVLKIKLKKQQNKLVRRESKLSWNKWLQKTHNLIRTVPCGVNPYHGAAILLFSHNGCVRLASLGLPCGAHSGEPLTRTKRMTTHRFHSDVVYLGPAPSDPLHKQGTGGWPGWAPGMTSKAIYRNAPGQTEDDPGKLNERTQCYQTAAVSELVGKAMTVAKGVLYFNTC